MAAADKKTMDVAKPGKSSATPTTRPIIIGHGGMIKDPMVSTKAEETSVEAPEAAAESASPTKVSVTRNKVVQPLSAADEPGNGTVLAETTQTDVPADPEPTAETPAQTDEPETSKPDEAPNDAETDDNSDAVVDAVLQQVGNVKRKAGEPTEEEKKHQEALDKLVEEKKYFVPIGQVRRRHRRNVAVLLLILLLAAAGTGGYLAYSQKLGPFAAAPTDSAVAPTATAKPAVTVPAAALATYQDSTLKLSFRYPKSWGQVTKTDNSTQKTEKGKRVLLTFSAQPLVQIGLKSADWKDNSRDVERICNQPGFTLFTQPTTDLGNGLRVTFSQNDRFVYEQMEGGLCGDLVMYGNVKFTKNPDYTGVSIRYTNRVNDKFDLAQRIADYQKDYNKYFPESLRTQITDLAKSVTEL